MIRFEWVPEKAKQNHQKHRVCFEEAVSVFYDPLSATFTDSDHSIDELRLITIGFSSHSRLLVISHTERGKNIRIISARVATLHERRRHEN